MEGNVLDDPKTAPEERQRAGVAREYRNDDIVVYWQPQFCIHSRRCIQGLPQVFNAQRRPWVEIDAAIADEIAATVLECPSGALSFARFDGGPQEEAPDETTITPRPNGPLAVRGALRIVAADGTLIREATRVTLCRCGQSENKPFCDGSHRRVGFRAP